MAAAFDAIVAGSGFGGAIAAFRPPEAGKRVLVLERGRRWNPGNFPRDRDITPGGSSGGAVRNSPGANGAGGIGCPSCSHANARLNLTSQPAGFLLCNLNFGEKLRRLNLIRGNKFMWKAMAAITVVLGTMSVAGAQTITNPNEIASRLHFWAQEAGDPVYYGEVRNVNPRNMRVLGYYQCLAIAFIKYEDGVFYYAHKMWGKSSDGSCHYDDVTSFKVGNHGACVKDTDAGFGTAIGTARMTKNNIDYMHSIFRTIDTKTRRVGETAACIPPKGVGAGLYSIKIENGRFKVMTTRPLDYEVNIDAQDPHNPPTNPVF